MNRVSLFGRVLQELVIRLLFLVELVVELEDVVLVIERFEKFQEHLALYDVQRLLFGLILLNLGEPVFVDFGLVVLDQLLRLLGMSFAKTLVDKDIFEQLRKITLSVNCFASILHALFEILD